MVEQSNLISIYQSIVELKTHEGELVWSRFNGFVVTHTIFLILIGQILFSADEITYRYTSLVFVSATGLLLSFLWLISTVRGFESVEFWGYSSIQLFDQINKELKIRDFYSDGNRYFKENGEILFTINKRNKKYLQRSILTQLIPINTRWTAYLSIVVILIAYLTILAAVCLGFFKR